MHFFLTYKKNYPLRKHYFYNTYTCEAGLHEQPVTVHLVVGLQVVAGVCPHRLLLHRHGQHSPGP